MRRWTSRIRTIDREAYIEYVRRTGIADYGSTDGNLGVQMLVRDLGDGTTEVSTLSWWTSIEEIRRSPGMTTSELAITQRITASCWRSPKASSIATS